MNASIFAGTADYYAKYRPRYPRQMLADLVSLSVGRRGRSLVDLGCGTGEVALPLSPSFDSVLAIGSAAILGGGSEVWEGKAGWHAVAVAVIRHWLGEQRRAGRGSYRVAKQHRDFLEPAGFSVRSRHYLVEHVWNADSIVGYLFSTSFANPSVLADNAEAFEADLRARLRELNPADEFPETLDFYALIASK